MNREVHVRLSEHLRGKIPWVIRPPVAQLESGRGKTRKTYLWAYRSNYLAQAMRIIVFDYQTGRSGEHVRNFLGSFTYWSMIAVVTKPCSPCCEGWHRRVLSWAAGHMRAESFSIYTAPIKARWPWRCYSA